MHVLYLLQSMNVANLPESSTSTSKHYEKFFLSLVSMLIIVQSCMFFLTIEIRKEITFVISFVLISRRGP